MSADLYKVYVDPVLHTVIDAGIGAVVGNIVCHYANMSVQYTAIFHGYKNDYFQMKNCNYFLIFAQNIDCGYTLEPPH